MIIRLGLVDIKAVNDDFKVKGTKAVLLLLVTKDKTHAVFNEHFHRENDILSLLLDEPHRLLKWGMTRVNHPKNIFDDTILEKVVL